MAVNVPLKSAFFERGLSQISVAGLLGMDDSRLSLIVNGHKEATEEEKRRLAKVLKKSVQELFPQQVA